MSWLNNPFRVGDQQSDSIRIETANEFIQEHTALYRHYCIPEVQRHVKQFTDVNITHDEATQIVQGIRDQHCMGPIAWYNRLTTKEAQDLEARGEI